MIKCFNQQISYDNLLTTIELNPSQILISPINSDNNKKKKNYGRIVKRLKHKLHYSNIILQKTDKSKVFHLGKLEDYQTKSKQYMEKTQAYICLNDNDPLQELIKRTNKYLLDLRLAHWLNQKQYEEMCINPVDAKLAHLYYLPKAHKIGTPLRPIISGLKHPTIKISRYLDGLLRPLFNKMASDTTVDSGCEIIKKLYDWSKQNLNQDTVFCTLDVIDLYTMIPQFEGVMAIKKMMDHLKLTQINGLKTEVIIRLCRFVMQNNYFTYEGKFYHQVRGGAMGSPLTLTIANCYMFFFERQLVKQINNGNGIYMRYIDDIFITINWPLRHLHKQIENWNQFDSNIKLNKIAGHSINFLDLYVEIVAGRLFTKVYHKPSYEPYYLPFESVHHMHIKKNIPYTMLIRAIKYCSTFEEYLNEREKLRMALLLNKYPGSFIDKQFNRVMHKFNINCTFGDNNYTTLREKFIYSPIKEKVLIDYKRTMFVHFTFCSNMVTFPTRFHNLWNKYFNETPINDVTPIVGTRNTPNLQRQLVCNK
jgi:hypothetical protein